MASLIRPATRPRGAGLVIVALLLALLAAVPAVPACGGSEGGGETLLVGVLAEPGRMRALRPGTCRGPRR